MVGESGCSEGAEEGVKASLGPYTEKLKTKGSNLTPQAERVVGG